MEALVWFLVIALMIVGLAGTFIPVVPGAPIILAAAVIHKIFLPEFLAGWTLAGLAVLAAGATALDMAAAIGGAKWYGATSWGILGSGIGAIIGLFFAVPGILLGAVLGAILGEMIFAKKPLKAAAKAGLGAGLGLLASAAGRAAICVLMIAVFAIDCFMG